MQDKGKQQYRLQITDNSKTGPAFSLPRAITCVNKTETCTRVCYGRSIRYQSKRQKEKRTQNYLTIELLLEAGGPELLAETLMIMIDRVRPIDWISSRVTETLPGLPWTLRIHDVGDFYSTSYVHAWLLAMSLRPQCSFWFYTRSFLDPGILQSLNELCALPNCQGWLSVDKDNYDEGLLAFSKFRSHGWKLALLQEEETTMPDDLIPALIDTVRDGEAINFPKHHAGRHVTPANTMHIPACPQVLGKLRLETDSTLPRPCQSCAFCLPDVVFTRN